MVDYPWGKFGDCSYSRFGSNTQTDTQTLADERFTPATLYSIQGGTKNGGILSHCKYSENSMTELRRNIANIFLLIIVCFDDVTVFIYFPSVFL